MFNAPLSHDAYLAGNIELWGRYVRNHGRILPILNFCFTYSVKSQPETLIWIKKFIFSRRKIFSLKDGPLNLVSCGAQDEFTLAAIAKNLRRLAKLVARRHQRSMYVLHHGYRKRLGWSAAGLGGGTWFHFSRRNVAGTGPRLICMPSLSVLTHLEDLPKGLQIRLNGGMRNIDACLYVRPSDRTTLERLVAHGKTPQKIVARARIVLLSGRGFGTPASKSAAAYSRASPNSRLPIETWLTERNAKPKPFKWTAKANIIRERNARARRALEEDLAAGTE